MTRSGPMRAALLTMFSITAGCAYDAPPASPPEPSTEALWRDQVYPLLLRDCGFPECHGAPGRFFRVFGPGRTRLSEEAVGPEGEPIDVEVYAQTGPIEEAEMRASYDRARSMLASASRAEDSLLVRKPLAVERGGAPHMGVDEHGRDVYPSPDDEGYQLLLRWAQTGFRGE